MTEPHIEMILFAKAPAVTAKIPRKVQLRFFRFRRVGTVVGSDRELHFLSYDERGLIDRQAWAVQMSSDRTKVATGANEKRRSHLLVDNPLVALAPQARKRDA